MEKFLENNSNTINTNSQKLSKMICNEHDEKIKYLCLHCIQNEHN